MDLKSKPLQFFESKLSVYMPLFPYGFYEKTVFMEKNVKDGNYCCFESLSTFIVEKEATLDEDLISMIVAHLDSLKESFDYYFSEEMKFCDKNIWIVNPFQSDVVATGISTKADEESNRFV
ncbi:Zinc finger BED domain-containing protein 5 [Trichinella sp. T6]|nr:Zinc finger BED domain-containing protein 5 [Trichinella sp. T6]